MIHDSDIPKGLTTDLPTDPANSAPGAGSAYAKLSDFRDRLVKLKHEAWEIAHPGGCSDNPQNMMQIQVDAVARALCAAHGFLNAAICEVQPNVPAQRCASDTLPPVVGKSGGGQ